MKLRIVCAFVCSMLLLGACGISNDSKEKIEENVIEDATESQMVENEQEVTETEICSETEAVIKPEPADEDLVLIKDYIPDIVIDLKYATKDNFTGQVIYESADAYLRYGTVKRLMVVQNGLKPLGYKLLIWDSYRPVEAQFKLWEICPDSTYVANPNKGYSSHSRGNTIDVSIVTLAGKEVEMPTGFDDFSVEADRDYSDVSQTAAENALMLEQIMEDAGFRGYSGEWWHYTDTTDYPVIE